MNRKILFGFALFAAVFFFGTVWLHPLLALAVLFLSHMLLLYPTLIANCQWWGPVVRRFATSEREVWLTIDDGPDPVHTPRMLDLLARYEAQATFFLIGEKAEKFPREVERIRAAGHGIGNHTFTHPSGGFWAMGPARIAAQLDRGPVRSRFFRAPAGLKNGFLHPLLARRGMQLIGWTVRGLDTVSSDPAGVADRIQRGLRPGAIILLHEGHRQESDPEFHPRCLELTLACLTSKGYRCVLPRPEQLLPRAGER